MDRWMGPAVAMVLLLAVLPACSDPPEKPNTGAVDTGIVFPPDNGTVDLDASGDDAAADVDDTFDITIPERQPCEEPGGWGCTCSTNDECSSGFCIDSEQGKVCTKTCIDSCPTDWKCVQTSGQDLVYVCAPLYTNLCRPCKDHPDCAQLGFDKGENLCIPFDRGGGFVDGSFCGTKCSEDKDCKAGYSCKDILLTGMTEPVKQCVPVSDDCSCIPAWTALQLSTQCAKTNDYGVCKAQRTCTEAGLTLCNLLEPSGEVCDNEDNDCDGQTDEDDAAGCVTWYSDNDGDNAGTGVGACLCQDPGIGFAANGGDCNDLNAAIKPGADEVCDNADNNCNGQTDEAGAKGCVVYYKDKDGDKWGDPDDSACLCPSKKPSDWIETPGDCNDLDDKVKPQTPEICNQGVDDNCNGETDEENGAGCGLWYVDVDKDGYGPADTAKCLCAGNKLYTVEAPGDCDDNEPKVHPTVLEICNGVDDDCNGTTDDGDAVKSCPAVANGQPGCLAGKCAVGKCNKGLFDIDGDAGNGCECSADNNFGLKGDNCGNAIDLGQMPDGSNTVLKAGNVMPDEAGDWYKFQATDLKDDKCDNFHVRVKFVDNPGNQFVFDLYRGGCAGGDQMCKAQVDGGWTTNFYGAAPSGPAHKGTSQLFGDVAKSPSPEKGGECPCSPAPGLPGGNICMDNSAPFYVHVYRKAGMPATCQAYTISVVNAPQ